MQIVGEWWHDEYGLARPTIEAAICTADGHVVEDRFLLDSGADRTVLSAALTQKLSLATNGQMCKNSFQGIGGTSIFIEVTATLEFKRDDGGLSSVRGVFALFVDHGATDMSILGRDVLNNFDVIISRPRNEILLLAPNHGYRVIK